MKERFHHLYQLQFIFLTDLWPVKTLSCFSDLERFWLCKASTEIAYIKQASSHMVANRFLSFLVRRGIYMRDSQVILWCVLQYRTVRKGAKTHQQCTTAQHRAHMNKSWWDPPQRLNIRTDKKQFVWPQYTEKSDSSSKKSSYLRLIRPVKGNTVILSFCQDQVQVLYRTISCQF